MANQILTVTVLSAIIIFGVILGYLFFIDPNMNSSVNPELQDCQLTRSQPEGPYFVDSMPSKKDLRMDTNSGNVEPGLALQLHLTFQKKNADNCEPLSNAKIEIWHTNASGDYSGLFNEGTQGKDFLRGNQLTNTSGIVIFDTLYPGWYPGRTIHIHFKVITDEINFISQFYFNQSLNDDIFSTQYQKYGSPNTLNVNDIIYNEELEMDVYEIDSQLVANYTVTV